MFDCTPSAVHSQTYGLLPKYTIHVPLCISCVARRFVYTVRAEIEVAPRGSRSIVTPAEFADFGNPGTSNEPIHGVSFFGVATQGYR